MSPVGRPDFKPGGRRARRVSGGFDSHLFRQAAAPRGLPDARRRLSEEVGSRSGMEHSTVKLYLRAHATIRPSLHARTALLVRGLGRILDLQRDFCIGEHELDPA